MATAVHVSLEEYLNTDYEPDCDYVDGVLEERNVGKNRHSETQSLIVGLLLAWRRQYGFRVMTEQRVQVSPTRVRIPDVCLVARDDRDEVTQRAPLLWIEILSPDDRFSRVLNRLQDCLQFGVKTIWIIDPYSNNAWILRREGLRQAEDGILRSENPALEVKLTDVLPED
ncbi:MAG TPA: Uma2 family endonuclease [Bryobacteraceae bacterium]|jgi:Uma2 family endonuclease|nr:Uma2 family endonuclease [Bryobacteraceae bacterium]